MAYTHSDRKPPVGQSASYAEPSLLVFSLGVNRMHPGIKLPPGDRRWAGFNAGFHTETHTPESLLAEIMRGHSFCCVLRDDACGLDHCGEHFCCPNRKNDVTHCGRPFGYRKASHFRSAQTLELDFDQGDQTSSIPHLLNDPFIAKYGAFLYSTLSSTPLTPKARVVFVLDGPFTDADSCRQARSALLCKYPQSDQSIKDAARFLYGSDPSEGECRYGW